MKALIMLHESVNRLVAFVRNQKTLDEKITLLASLLVLIFPPLMFVGSAAADSALSTIAVLFLIHSALTSNWQWLQQKWLRTLLLLWAYMVIRSFFAEIQTEALRRSLPFVRFFLFSAALAFWLLQAKTMRRYFMFSMLITLVFLMYDGLGQWATGFDVFGHYKVIDPQGHVRLTGPFAQNKPILGIMLAWLSFPVCLPFLFSRKTGFSARKLFVAIAFALTILCVIALSGERMALLLSGLGWAVALLLMPIDRRVLLLVTVASILCLGALASFVPDVFDRQVSTTLNTFSHWQESPYGKIMGSDITLAMKSPVFGVGANHFRSECPKLYPNADEAYLKTVCNIHPHNIYLEWLIENGVIGLGLFITFIANVFSLSQKAWPVMRNNPFFLGWLIAFGLRVWPIGSTTGFFSNWGAPPFWLALGVLLAYSSLDEKGKTHHAGIALPL